MSGESGRRKGALGQTYSQTSSKHDYFTKKYSQKTLHCSPSWASYGVSFVSSYCHLHPESVINMLDVILCCYRQCYKEFPPNKVWWRQDYRYSKWSLCIITVISQAHCIPRKFRFVTAPPIFLTVCLTPVSWYSQLSYQHSPIQHNVLYRTTVTKLQH